VNLFLFDKKYLKKNFNGIAGIDEVGRGTIAGPVTAAAVIFPKNCHINGVNDSKKISAKKRKELSVEIKQKALSFSCISIDNVIIEKINILQASLLAMKKAILSLGLKPDICLIDGINRIEDLSICQDIIIGGDGKSASIAAASILAKTIRDEIMIDYSKLYPHYNFEKHKGYPTEEHIKAIKKFGICPIHRRTFTPIKQLLLKKGAKLKTKDKDCFNGNNNH
jgi:ribonuclease HII